jgi:copper chaperone CopZ
MCAASLQPELKSTNGVLDANVYFKRGTAWIKYDDKKIPITRLRKVIKDGDSKQSQKANNANGNKPNFTLQNNLSKMQVSSKRRNADRCLPVLL